jgi:hypothetical protein
MIFYEMNRHWRINYLVIQEIKPYVKLVNHCPIHSVGIFHRRGKGGMKSFCIGFFTGECVTSSEDMNRTVCEMNGWCPEELSKSM